MSGNHSDDCIDEILLSSDRGGHSIPDHCLKQSTLDVSSDLHKGASPVMSCNVALALCLPIVNRVAILDFRQWVFLPFYDLNPPPLLLVRLSCLSCCRPFMSCNDYYARVLDLSCSEYRIQGVWCRVAAFCCASFMFGFRKTKMWLLPVERHPVPSFLKRHRSDRPLVPESSSQAPVDSFRPGGTSSCDQDDRPNSDHAPDPVSCEPLRGTHADRPVGGRGPTFLIYDVLKDFIVLSTVQDASAFKYRFKEYILSRDIPSWPGWMLWLPKCLSLF